MVGNCRLLAEEEPRRSQGMMARHAYLGDLEDVARPHAAHFASGAVVELPLMFLRDIVLFPGEELPLRVLSDTNLEAIRYRLANEASMLAVLCPGQGEPVYGTTVRVERTGLTGNSATLTGAAKQRFRLRSLKSIPGGRGIYGTVEILADLTPAPLPFPAQWKYTADTFTHDLNPQSRRRRVRPRFPSYWGFQQYALFDAAHLVDRIQQIMISSAHCNWFRKLVSQEPSKESLVRHLTGPSDQQDPVRFAFWMAANLPVSHVARLELLKTECIVRLLRREIAMLEQLHENIYCSHCRTFLAQTRDIFSMSNDGAAAGTFVNPGGFVHQIMTLREVHMERLFVDATRSAEDSWFPGYAWSIVHCGVCYNHLGWQFDCIESPQSSPETNAPARFFGFRRTALTQSRASEPTATPTEWSMVGTTTSDEEDDPNRHPFEPSGDSEEDDGEDHDSSSESGGSSSEEYYDAVAVD